MLTHEENVLEFVEQLDANLGASVKIVLDDEISKTNLVITDVRFEDDEILITMMRA